MSSTVDEFGLGYILLVYPICWQDKVHHPLGIPGHERFNVLTMY